VFGGQWQTLSKFGSPSLHGHGVPSARQFCLHEAQVSAPSHEPSPHSGGRGPQSCGQLSQVSLPLHASSPQAGTCRSRRHSVEATAFARARSAVVDRTG
jgi:hypothetical protein